MRKLNQNTELLSHLSAQSFITGEDELMRLACSKITNEAHRKHGFRTDYMFGYVAGALGKCAIVKHENAAGLILSNEDFKVPDYRLTLLTGKQLFVEVKNCNNLKMTFKPEWIKRQIRYAELNKLPLKIAVYWRKIGEWTLVDASELAAYKGNKCVLEVGKAMMLNEMATLGDMTLGTLLPLKFHLGFNNEDTIHVKDNEWKIVVKSADMYCRDTLITDPFEQAIAYKIMTGGNLKEDNELIMDEEGKPKRNIFVYDKFERDENHEQDFDMVGSLSRIISSSYLHATTWNNDESASEQIMPAQEPEDFQIFIPEDYKSISLPLWRFILKPNKIKI